VLQLPRDSNERQNVTVHTGLDLVRLRLTRSQSGKPLSTEKNGLVVILIYSATKVAVRFGGSTR